jgi:ADP-heptose:LPS heptosyltransferase
MDSGNGHLAAMYGVKVITIWGVTHPYAGFAPFGQPEDYSLLPDRNAFPKIPTSIFGNAYPEGYEKAASSISPEKIIEKVKAIL